jgi:hypothetical protein
VRLIKLWYYLRSLLDTFSLSMDLFETSSSFTISQMLNLDEVYYSIPDSDDTNSLGDI